MDPLALLGYGDRMTATPGIPPTRREGSLRASLYVFVLVAGVAAGLTLLYLGMRAVMEIGGVCADGGPYVPRQSCPQGVPLAMIGGIWGGLIMAGIYVFVTIKYQIPSLVGLAWPALFLSLGWNFLDFGIDPPGDSGLVWGWLICGGLFMLMGGVPLLVVLGPVLRSFNKRPEDGPVGISAPVAAMKTKSVARLLGNMSATSGGDLVAKLERLDVLRRNGALTDAEFAAAKKKLLEGA